MHFEASVTPPNTYTNAYWFLFSGTELLIDNSNSITLIPQFQKPSSNHIITDQALYLGTIASIHCFCASVLETAAIKKYVFKDLRSLYGELDQEFYILAGKALQLINWNKTHKFCGQCGTPMTTSTFEYAKICPACELTLYPRISPAIIVAIVNNGKILLARRNNSQMYSVIAGYVEVGEKIEQTVLRETQEEVGIEVKNIQYFSSQSWPFSYALMLAFTAEYKSGEITPDGKEIEEAKWFAPNELPERIPGHQSVARELIEWFKNSFISS
jgi:NAD+ diphosphatase